MRAILQRVSNADVMINGKIYGAIKTGLVILLGIETSDNSEDIDWLIKKITQMRIFGDDSGKMNRSILDIQGELLVVSQFTLYASTKKGNRPSFMKSAHPAIAVPLYNTFLKKCSELISTQSGVFGADMKVSLVNDGPVTIVLDSKNKE